MKKIFRVKLFFPFCILLAMLFSCGCEEPVKIPVKKCPGKATTTASLKALNDSSSQVQPFIAYGKGLVQFYNEEKKKYEKNDISAVKIWFAPPDKMRFWGDVVFNNRGLDVGSNESEFWFTAMPKELGNVYIWGLWSQQKNEEDLLLSPRIMRQGFGIIDTENEKNFSLLPGTYQDVLIQKDNYNRIIKKIYIDNCSYRAAKIEYYNDRQMVFAVLELSDYKIINDKMTLPMKLQVINNVNNGNADVISITLKSVNPQDKIKTAVFQKPPTKRFANIYKLVNGKAVEQSK